MNKFWQYFGVFIVSVAAAGLTAQVAVAQAAGSDIPDEELVTIGSRRHEARSVADSTVPIDVISGEDFNSLGTAADLTDNLRNLIPSYTATPATGDGSAFVRTTSLRGTAPDESLVLINGKRRHRSALIQFLAPAAGAGAQAADVGMIPGIGVKRVEVLRDGASSQYGSDAIAGVINFVMKDASEGGEVQVQYGQYYEGEQSVKVSANGGFAAGENGFINASFEYVDNEGLSRGLQVPDAQALIDSGVTEVGQDAVFGDAPFVQSWGRPETKGLRFFVNSGFEISDSAQLYARLGYGDTEGRYRFFWRNPASNSVFTSQLPFGGGCATCNPNPDPDNPDPNDTQSLNEQGFTGLPGGFTPFLDGNQKDASLVLGTEGTFDSGLNYDLSFGYGRNQLDYFLNNTVNQSLGFDPVEQTLPQRDFDVGGYKQEEKSVNADFSLPLKDNVNLGFGTEWREETYTALVGEPNSYFMRGASGLKGVTPDDAGSNSRDNIAFYADVEHDITDAFLLQYALRYEDYSDFGDTLNWKIATRYRFADSFAVRGAISTGFKAPSPGQSSVRTTITTADGNTGLLVEEGLLPPTDPLAVAVGGTALKEETSLNYSLGFTADIGEHVTLTVDAYLIEIDDRIYKTGDITAVDPDTGLPTGGTVAFFTNALDVEHKGVDVVLSANNDWGSSAVNTSWSFAFNYNEVEVTDQKAVQTPTGPVLPVSDSNIFNIENNFPNERFVLSANTGFGEMWTFLIRANYYGDHFDERGTPGDDRAKIDATVYVDLDLALQLNDNWRFNLGAVNVFDQFVGKIGPPDANRLSVGLQYPRRSAANYEGGSWYLRGTFSF